MRHFDRKSVASEEMFSGNAGGCEVDSGKEGHEHCCWMQPFFLSSCPRHLFSIAIVTTLVRAEVVRIANLTIWLVNERWQRYVACALLIEALSRGTSPSFSRQCTMMYD